MKKACVTILGYGVTDAISDTYWDLFTCVHGVVGIMTTSNPQSLRLLLVEDDPDTAFLLAETLQDYFGAGCVQVCSTVAEGKDADISRIDMVLSDINLPDGSGLELLDHCLRLRPDIPVVLVTAEGVLENAATAIRRGAYDYIVKAGDYLFTIPLIVEKNWAIWRTKQENRSLQAQLRQTLEEVRVKNNQLEEAVYQLKTMAATDPLTELSNRRSFGQSLGRCFAEAVRYGHDLAAVMIDLDNFKLINDTLGHQAGDELLRKTASILEAQCRRSDVAGRFGGDEFVLLLPQADATTACQVAQRISDEFNATVLAMVGDGPIAGQMGLSMGVASLTLSKPKEPEQILAHADQALYQAKQAGKSCVKVFDQEDLPQSDAVA